MLECLHIELAGTKSEHRCVFEGNCFRGATTTKASWNRFEFINFQVIRTNHQGSLGNDRLIADSRPTFGRPNADFELTVTF